MGMRKCSQCAKTGHNSRTCRSLENIVGQSVKLFGVELGCFPTSDDVVSSSSTSPELLLPPSYENSDNLKNGNFSNSGITLGHRRKGVAWSEEEHKLFLMGLKKLGKGDWRGISKNFVTTRTSAQVASHAQKYFLRHNNNAKKNMLERNESSEEKPITYCRLIKKYHGIQNSSPSLELSLASAP